MSTIVVAVSGGCDSVALLHILRSLQNRLLVNLHVASLDHGMRGEAGQGDVIFVRGLAEQWQLSCTVGRADVPELARQWGIGLEAAARRARYDFLARVAQQESSSCVAVGHHANDQAETILLHIVRGSGARGLGGMRILSPMPFHPEIKLFRPLLSLSRVQLESYCAAHKLTYRRDETNYETDYRRNYLRHNVVEKLFRLNPDVLGAFGRLVDSLAVDEEFLSEVVEAQLTRIGERLDTAWRIGRQEFCDMHPALQRRLLREVFRRVSGDPSGLTHAVTLKLVAWVRSARTGAKRDIGASTELVVDYDDIWIKRQGSQLTPPGYRLIPSDTNIGISSSTPYARHGLTISITDPTAVIAGGSRFVLKTGCHVRLRSRRPGDRFKPKGMGGQSRKLKDWMIDRKIPRYLRDRIPLVAVDGDIIAICLGQNWHLAEPDPSEPVEDSSPVLNLE
ncbi:MAG: tRNA lysidine(34) synthetase TilS [Chloroflexi bacterium]|nr:tRNA lysidine(34) synthetase TilS [Chloroflexota bacterium]